MAQRIRKIPENTSVDEGSNDAASTASQADERGAPGPGRSETLPVVSAVPAMHSSHLRHSSSPPPRAIDKSGAGASRPAYTGQAASSREVALGATAIKVRAAVHGRHPLKALIQVFENAVEVRLVVPTSTEVEGKSLPYYRLCDRKWLMQLPIKYLQVFLEPCDFADVCGRDNQLAFVRLFLENCNDVPGAGTPGMSIGLDVPMRKRTLVDSTQNMESWLLLKAIANSKVLEHVRVSGYKAGLDKTSWLSTDLGLLGNNPHAHWFEMEACEINDDDASELAAGIKQNRFIKTLFLHDCLVSPKGVEALASVLRHRPDIQVFGCAPSQDRALAQAGRRHDGGGTDGINTTAGSAGATHAASTAAAHSAGTPADTAASPRTAATTAGATNASTQSFATMHAAVPGNVPVTDHDSASVNAPPSLPEAVSGTADAHSIFQQMLVFREYALRAAGLQVHEAMQGEAPLEKLKKVFAEHQWVRVELNENWFASKASGGVARTGNPYMEFVRREWLEQASFCYLELINRHGGNANVEHGIDLICTLLENCRDLSAQKKSSLRVGIDVPAPGSAAQGPGSKFDRLFRALAADKSVMRLNLSGVDLARFASLDSFHFFTSLSLNTTLQELYLCNASLSDKDACALAEALKQNRSVKLLNLRGCATSDMGGKVLYGALLSKRTVDVIL